MTMSYPTMQRHAHRQAPRYEMFNQFMCLFAYHLDSDFLHTHHGVIILVVGFLRFEIFAVRVLRRGNAEKVIVARACFKTEFLPSISETPGALVCTVCTRSAHKKCAHIFHDPLTSVHTFVLAFSGVCTHFFQCFCECAHQFYGHFLRVRIFFEAQFQECAGFFHCCSSVHRFPRPATPNSRVRVPGSGFWLAVPPAGGLSHSCHRRFQ
jgi:hypothetical protein